MNQINIKTLSCVYCNLLPSDEKFLKDKNNQPIYYHMLNKNEAVIFCSAAHSSSWYSENKDKVWDRK